MNDVEELTLHHPELLQRAIDLLTLIQTSPWNARPLIGATLDALDNGDLGTALQNIDAARFYTLTGKKETNIAAALIRQAFNLD